MSKADNEQLRKEMADKLLKSKEELLKKCAKEVLEGANIDKHIKAGKLNSNNLVSEIRNGLNKEIREIERIK